MYYVYIESRWPISVLQAEGGARIGERQMPLAHDFGNSSWLGGLCIGERQIPTAAGVQEWRLGLDEQVSAFCVATGGGGGCVVALHSASRARCFALGVTRTVCMCTYGRVCVCARARVYVCVYIHAHTHIYRPCDA